MRLLTRIIDKTVIKLGEASSLLMAFLVIIMCYEVARRYFFNAPTIWALEFTTFLYGMHFVMGFGYTEYFDGHVKVDIFSKKMSRRLQDIVYIVLTTCVTLPVVLLLCIWAWDNAIISTKILEDLSSAWAPPIWPVKLIMGLGFTLLLLQVISNLIKRFLSLRQKNPSTKELS